jgi:CRP-like cAMP-binding protein
MTAYYCYMRGSLSSLISSNRLLACLPKKDHRKIADDLELVSLKARHTAYERGKTIEHIYFPVNSVISIFAGTRQGEEIEVAAIGNEGMVGLPVFLGTSSTPGKAYAQVPGESFRIKAEVFWEHAQRSDPFVKVTRLYAHALIMQIMQRAACNRNHSPLKRCARCLLTTQDQVQSERFPLTQEILGYMLGIRRTGVSAAASALKKRRIINYNRGMIEILNRQELESASCECYVAVKQEFERLFKVLLQRR